VAKAGRRRKPTTWDEIDPKRWLRAETLQDKPRTLKISALYQEVLEEGTEDWETIISFERTAKELVLNATNKRLLKAMFGKKPQDWVGHNVTLQPEMVDAFGERVEAVRVAGSPDIAADIRVDEPFGRGRLKRTLTKTKRNGPPTSRSPEGATK
jgi:hypothetical protein